MLIHDSSWICEQLCSIPCEYKCMWCDIAHDYLRLKSRYENTVTKNKRLWELAEPRMCRNKPTVTSNRKCHLQKYPTIDLIDKSDHMGKTRTEMLSYPLPRILLSLKSHPSYGNFNDKRKSRVNYMLRKSLLSMYSHISCTQPPKRPPPKGPLFDNKKNGQRLTVLAAPRRDYSKYVPIVSKHLKENSEYEVNAGRYATANYKRLRELATPRSIVQEKPFEWKFTRAMNNYKPSERLTKIAAPKSNFVQYNEVFRKSISPNYKPSKRIEKLAEPIRIHKREVITGPTGEDVYQTRTRALYAKPSKRIKELAEPRSYENIHIRNNPYEVKRSALKYKSSPRVIKLATPKRIQEKFTRGKV